MSGAPLQWDDDRFYWPDTRDKFRRKQRERHEAELAAGNTMIAHLPDCPCAPCSHARPDEYRRGRPPPDAAKGRANGPSSRLPHRQAQGIVTPRVQR